MVEREIVGIEQVNLQTEEKALLCFHCENYGRTGLCGINGKRMNPYYKASGCPFFGLGKLKKKRRLVNE
jgi:hypothetical protein